jgi:excinuclease UvrABC ATPase subunit
MENEPSKEKSVHFFYFGNNEVERKLQAMSDVGLNYITLGQPLSTLSGGELQRIKLASELHKKGSIYVMDVPTTGLHMSDIGHLLGIMNRLADAGNTVIVIEHNLDVISQAEWIIDMGPDGGSKGGQMVFEGTPSQIIHAEQSITGRYLNALIPDAQDEYERVIPEFLVSTQNDLSSLVVLKSFFHLLER